MADRKWLADHLPDGRLRAARRPHIRVVDARPLGAARTRHPRVAHERRRLATRDSRSRRAGRRGRPGACARLAYLLRRRPRLGALRPDRAGRAALGPGLGSRRARTAPFPAASASTGRPAGSRSATARTAPSSRASTRSSRRTWPGEGEGAGLRREGRPCPPPRGGSRRDPLHAHGRRSHVVGGRARAIPLGREPILTRDGEPLVDAKGRRSYVTSAGAAPSVGKHVLMAYLPPDRAEVGAAARRRVHGRALPGHGRRRRLDTDLRPRERADPLVRILVCVKRVPLTGGKIVAHRGRAGDRDQASRVHDQPA